MKKVFSKFASTIFVGASIFMGVNTITPLQQNIPIEEIRSKDQSINNNIYVYNLAPWEGFNPNSPKFNDYWNDMERFNNGSIYYVNGGWLMGVESVESVGSNYQINFDYSFYNDNLYGSYKTSLNVYNTNKTYNQTFTLSNINNNNNGIKESESASILVPKTSVKNGKNLVFDMKFIYKYSPSYTFEVQLQESQFDVINYPYLDEFYINSFSFINDSITDTSFEFLIDVRLNENDAILPYPNNLTLYSNGVPLNTQFESYQGNLLKYKVTNLTPNSTYTNFAIGINGYSELKSIDTYVINTKASRINPNAGLIAGSVIGVLILLLLIALLIIFIIKRSNKVEEHNVYNEYITYEDENGEQVTLNQEEFENQNNYQENNYIEPENEYLNGSYNFIPNEDSYEEDPGFY